MEVADPVRGTLSLHSAETILSDVLTCTVHSLACGIESSV
jgi:hypothetical protein